MEGHGDRDYGSKFHRSLLRYGDEASPRAAADSSAQVVASVRAGDQALSSRAKRQRAASLTPADMPTCQASSSVGWIHGDDVDLSSAGDRGDPEWQRWQRIVATFPHSWCDEAFPATQLSIDGKEDTPRAAPPTDAIPRCRCGATAKKSTVVSDTPNKGRPYFHCAARSCGFFAWADGGQSRHRSKAPFGWQRFPHLLIVSDFGFRATDLRQGGVGDCWFMSALAVVAERHDLIARLFTDTAVNPAGCYCLRFFLDGEWSSIVVDDRLPVTDTPRRAALAFEGKLAFSRCGDGSNGPSGQMLWACLIEKAYAKAHGSYKSTSGGEIQEALLDLTGAPTLSVNFNDGHFDSELLWQSMQEWKRLELPMGCATSGDDTGELREMGLCGSHAYSVLDLREVSLRDHHYTGVDGGGRAGRLRSERLVRVRNPHGVGEWNGDWSDRSDKWASVIRDVDGGSGAGATGESDGTFWIDWTHFLMGFSVVECCLAYRGWHCRSLPNAFPSSKSVWRVCDKLYRFTAPVGLRTNLYLMALQPSKRGAWCRNDRKKSYRPGDLSVMVARVGKDGDLVEAVIGGELRGAEKTGTLSLTLEPGASYLAIPYCLGANPTAAETTAKQPFKMRFYSSQPLSVQTEPFIEQCPESQQLVLNVLHEALLNLRPPRPHGKLLMSGEEKLVGRLKRRLVRAGPGCSVVVVAGSGVVAIIAANQSSTAATITVGAFTKSNVARGPGGKIKSDTAAANAYFEKLKAVEEQRKRAAAGGGGHHSRGVAARLIQKSSSRTEGFRWPAKWQSFRAATTVSPGELRLVLLLAKSGVQAQLGEIEATVIPNDATSSENRKAQADVRAPMTTQMSLHAFMGSGKQKKSAHVPGSPTAATNTAALRHAANAQRDGLFVAVPIQTAWLRTLCGEAGSGVGSATNCGGDHGLITSETPRVGFSCDVCGLSLEVGAAVYSCRQCNYDVCKRCFIEGGGVERQRCAISAEEDDLAKVLAASRYDAEMAAAIEASKQEFRQRSPPRAETTEDSCNSDDLAAAIAASLQDNYYRGNGISSTRPALSGNGVVASATKSRSDRVVSVQHDVVDLLSSEDDDDENDTNTRALVGLSERWRCSTCTFAENLANSERCEVCSAKRVP